MVVLKKIRSSSITETMVATVIVMIVFAIASLILNTLFSNTIKKEDAGIKNEMNKLHYMLLHNKLELPYTDRYKNWNIIIEKGQSLGEANEFTIEAENVINKRIIELNIEHY